VLEGLTELLELQRLDDELIAFKTEFEALPARRDSLVERRKAGEEQISSAKQSVQEAEASMRQTESSLQDCEALLQKLEGQQFQVKSNDAYSALLREIEQAKEAISERETQILEHMETIESASGEFNESKQKNEAAELAFEDEGRSIEVRDAELVKQIERLSGARTQLGPKVGPELLYRYERISQRRQPAVVLVTEERCEGCRVGIPPQSFIEVIRCESIVTCGNCMRMLIHANSIESQATG
jgi:hypothetical protein